MDETLKEACEINSHLFIVMLFSGLSNPADLWEKYRDHLSEDLHDLRRTVTDKVVRLDERVINRYLCCLQNIIISIGGN